MQGRDRHQATGGIHPPRASSAGSPCVCRGAGVTQGATSDPGQSPEAPCTQAAAEQAPYRLPPHPKKPPKTQESPAATSGTRKPWFSKECKFIGDFEHKHPGLNASKNLPMCMYSSTAGLHPRLPDQTQFQGLWPGIRRTSRSTQLSREQQHRADRKHPCRKCLRTTYPYMQTHLPGKTEQHITQIPRGSCRGPAALNAPHLQPPKGRKLHAELRQISTTNWEM